MLARIFFQISRTLRPTTCGQCPGNGQPRLRIARIGSMGGLMVPDGKVLSEVMVPSSAPVKGSQATRRHSPRIIKHFCGSEFTTACCFSALRRAHIAQVLGSASRAWGGSTGMDLLDVEGMLSLPASIRRNASNYVHRRRVRTNGATRRVLRVVGFPVTPHNDCIQGSAMACDAIFN